MKKVLDRINRNRYFLLFIVLFAYAQSIDSRIRERTELNAYTFTPDAAIGTLISVCILFIVLIFFTRRWQKSDIFSTTELLKIFSSSLISYLLIMQTISLAIAFIFDNIERNFNREIVTLTTFSYLLDGFIYGSFFLAYNYYNKNKRNQEQLVKYNKALSESRINQLKTQLNPHFLFNNLNVLDQLIEEDKYKASDFLNEFADIYRFVLQTSDKKTIPISEELTFATQYFNLIRHKYGNSYQLIIENENCNGAIVPLSLQLLIENAVQHNLGTEKNPVCIKILTNNNNISISNNLIPKRNTKPASGRV
ncbi:hypothetical protein A9996_18795 [Gelidibacter algens]|uniref:sensor histidine kinase n=1 Tax=Gelidibacter algens TaxID=49280 RepID=UPI000804C242|nr:sensor histidine kinase [Gelidibacter algens]OBX19705.1 hypothetical protein A9996_18795 [Gelidibacter algens]